MTRRSDPPLAWGDRREKSETLGIIAGAMFLGLALGLLIAAVLVLGAG